ncbi:DUF5305 family protein [Halobaculum magnesiiphilum]|uniref:DUF5305 domain-containing protein n=1 Tax=Halobaculum magnesiiphilum TaxID=1017351 RepID=A0A8T8WE37_9EURY|nr:DUF5305 family protein [Halobaculum magnesiiphilum]QZP38132.1 DUF5305 domain-containing protein [Halobaculum magnesiiphilum]
MAVGDQLKLQLARNGLLIAAVVAVVGAASLAGAGYVYLTPPTEQVTEETNRQQVAAGVDTSAVVTGNETLYDRGTRLRNMPVYFTSASPDLTLHVEASVPDDRQVTVEHRLQVVIRGTRADQVFYENATVLSGGRATVSDGNYERNATLNVSQFRSEVATVQSAAPVGTFRVLVTLDVSYNTTDYTGEFNTSAPLVITGGAYWVDGDISDSRTHSRTVTTREVGSPNMRLVGLLAVLGVVLLVAGVLVRRAPTLVDVTAIETQVARDRYDEWISNGEIPTKREKEYVRTDSLEDLVDIAIDSSKRVIHDRDLEVYAVIEGDLVYFFSPNEDVVADWLDV